MHDPREMKDEASIRSPKQRNVRLWSAFFSLTCLAAVLECLFELFFNSDISGLSFMRYILDVIFIINIISRFFIGYEVHGVVITDPKKVRKKYLRTWFFFDLLSVLPFQALKQVHPYMRFLEASRCLRVFRLFTIISYFSKEPDTNKVLLTAFRMFSIMALSVQFSACLWFNQVCDADYKGHKKVCTKGDNWLLLLSESNLTGISDVEWYATSVYWSVITLCTIGYGDIHATNLEESTVASVVMLLGLLAFGFSMSSLSTVISNMASLRGRFHHRIEAVLHYMMHMDLPMEIQTMVHHYYYYLWLHQKGRNITGLMDDLPNVLREDISSSCYRSLIKKAKLFRNTANGFKMALSLKLKTYTYIPGQTLAKAGEINQNLYYIKHGHVQVFSQNPEVEIATLLPGTLFGEVHLLYEIPRNVTIRASTLCEITILEHKDLLSLFDEFPEAAVQISRDAKTRLQNLRCPIEEAYIFGLASIPQNVAFEREQWINLQPREQRIFAASFEYASNQIPPMNSFWKTTFHPQSAFIKTWRYFFSWCLTVSVFLEAWVFFFTHSADAKGVFTEDWGAFYFVFKVLIYIVAAFDIFVNLRTDVFTKDGHVTDLAVIFRVYRKSWNFYYDVLALLPLELISFAFGATEPWTVSCLVRLNRLLLIRRIYLYFRQNECDLYSHLYEQRIAKCLFIFFFSLHFCAGMLYLSACDNKRCLEESWAWNAGLKPSQSSFEHYIITVYWTTTTFTSVGYGDIVPGSLIEQCLAAIVGLIGMLVLTYVIGLMCATISDRNAKRLTFQNVFSEMRQFMERHGVAASLQIRVKNYMNLLWNKYQGAAYPGGPFLMHDLSIELKHSVLMAERGELLSQIPFFSEAEQSFIQNLALTSVIYSFPEGEIIQYSNTLSTELFCILQGTCQILKDDLSEIVGHYYKGMFFGEAGFLFGKPATLTVRAMTCCKIVVIDFDKVKVLLEKHPRLKSQIKQSCANPQRYATLVEDAKKLQESQSDVQDSPTHSASMRFQGSRNSSNSKCCTASFLQIYLMSLYFATSTLCTVGFGDIYPCLSASRAGQVFIMLIGVLFVGWLSGSVTGMLANTDALRAAYTEKAESMKLFLKSHRLTGALYNQVIGFYKFRWMCTKGFDQDKLSQYLPSSLVSDLSTVLYADFIAKVFGLKIQRTTTQESEINLLSTVEITRAGKLSVYFVEKGEVEVLSNNESKVLFKLSAGQYFGERSLLFHEPRAATIRAATNSEMYVLSQKSLHEILKYYPHIHEQMQSSADEIKDLLHEDYQIHAPARPDSAPTTFRRAGWEQLYRDHMTENEERAILRLQPLHVRLWTRVSPLLIWFLLKIFNFIRMSNNRTMDADNSFRVVYQYTGCILFTILFWAITLMSSVHSVNVYLLLLTTCTQVFQMFEIFLKFHIATYDDHRAFASDYKSTSHSYLTRKFGFAFDMACAFPFGLIIVHLVEKDSPLFLPIMIIYARIAHLPRIISLLVFMWKEEQSITSNLLCIRMIKFFVHSVLFVHCAAMLCVSFVEIYGVMSWIAEIEISDFSEMYKYAVYWIVQIYTTVGFGDILSLNLGEVMACTFIMILSKIQVIYKMGLLIATQTNKNTLQVAFEAKLQTILEYMKHERIPRQLQNRVSHFYNYQWNRNKGICTEELFRGVPRCLKMDVLMSICGEYLKSHHLFSHFTIPVMRELSARVTFRCFPVGECIYRKGDSGTEIYFLLIGKVNLCLDTRGHEVYQRLCRGTAFGDRIVIEHTRHDTAIAANYVDVAVLSKTSLASLSHLYPAAMHKLKEKLADIQQE
ncbi:cyclic nucleotide-gated cation channel alpha-3-like isoform X4 [Danio rerio]|uniref:Cyclic nucleotide-gated cation channel alpha-3-like isoform X4 n=2 Tax=Danio rerio TaxID=7955 RepID=A0AC58GZZ2_DANRE